MADNTALAAALMGLQRKKTDPLESQREFARSILKQGSATTPVLSWQEGLARSLQGAVGGVFEGFADREQKGRDTNNTKVLADALAAPDQQSMTNILKGYQGESDVIAPILGQLLGQRMGQFKSQEAAGNFASAYGGANPAGGATPPIAPPSVVAATSMPTPLQPGGITSNNVGNITNGQGGFRQYESPQAGAVDLVSLLRSYPVKYNQGQPMTLAQIGARYAPAPDGKDPMTAGNDPAVWARNVGQIAGIDPNQPLDFDNPAVVTAVVRGINGQEKKPVDRQAPEILRQGVASGMDGGAAPLTINMPGPAKPQQGDQPAADGGGTPLPPSATSGPPDVPRPQPTADQIAKYKKLIADGVLSGPQAVQELDKEITGQWSLAKQQALEVWKDQQSSKRQNEKAAIDLGQKAPMEMITKRVDAYEKEIRPKAEAAVQEVNSIHQVRQLLDAGAFTGMGADAQAAGSRLAQALGIDWGTDRQANTAALQSAMGQRVLTLVKNLGSGTGISNADREYAEKVAGGQISVGEPAMRKILDIGERAARATLKSHDVEANRLKQLPGMAQLGDQQFSVQTPPTYEEWSKANPAPKTEAAPQPAQTEIPTVQTPEEARKLPPGTQFRTPDGRILMVPRG